MAKWTTLTTVDVFGLPPEEALRWFRQKGLTPTFDWRDQWGEQHAKAFTVAKATQLDVLADIYMAVSDAIENGQSLGQFRKELRPLLQQKGWWGEKEVVDPQTGEVIVAQLGSAWRLRTIYATNLRMAHAAGRWERILRTAEQRPWLRYVAIDDGRTRDQHLAWHNIVLRYDHPWWKTHYPPNGWGCRCKVMQLSDRDLERYGYLPTERAPDAEMVVWRDTRNGITRQVPRGISPGFDYNVGEARMGWSPSSAPATEAVLTYRDYGRPAASRITDRPQAPERWGEVHTTADVARIKDEFRVLFGGDEAPVKDPTGDQTKFTQRYLDHLIEKAGSGDHRRATFAPAAKATVEHPAEIWLVPTRLKNGQVAIRKRYIQFFDGQNGGYMVVVDRDQNGYAAWTSYPKTSIDSKREGYLLFPR